MVLDMYQGDRHVRAHGAAAQPRKGNHGLVASCAFAQGIFKAFIRPVKRECPEGSPGTMSAASHSKCKGRRRRAAQRRWTSNSASSKLHGEESTWS